MPHFSRKLNTLRGLSHQNDLSIGSTRMWLRERTKPHIKIPVATHLRHPNAEYPRKNSLARQVGSWKTDGANEDSVATAISLGCQRRPYGEFLRGVGAGDVSYGET